MPPPQARPSRRPSKPKSPGALLLSYFMHGVLIVAPLMITIAIIHWMFAELDGLLKPLITVPGLGFIIIIVSMVLIGWTASMVLVDRLIVMVDHWLERLPGVSFIYTSVRDFFKAFVGSKRRFTHTVRVQIFDEDVWVLGFLTDEALQNFEFGEDYVAVYVPQAYNVAGQLYLVRRERVHPLANINATDAMKYAASGGAIEIADVK